MLLGVQRQNVRSKIHLKNLVLVSDTHTVGKVVHVLNTALCDTDLEGVEICIHSFLTMALDGGEWSASNIARFTPGQ
jgi:hypothetical protein